MYGYVFVFVFMLVFSCVFVFLPSDDDYDVRCSAMCCKSWIGICIEKETEEL